MVVAYLFSWSHRTASDANFWMIRTLFIAITNSTCWEIFVSASEFSSDYSMFLQIFLNSCPVNLLLVRRHQAENIIVKRLIDDSDSTIFTTILIA